MTGKTINKWAMISLIVGALMIGLAMGIGHFVPIELGDGGRRVLGIILAIPWVAFLVLMIMSLSRR